jgi:hypothetical protein
MMSATLDGMIFFSKEVIKESEKDWKKTSEKIAKSPRCYSSNEQKSKVRNEH